MRGLFVPLAALSAALGPFHAAHADTLAEAMVAAQETNPTLAAQRQRLRATRETLPQAYAAALPQISVSGSITASDRDSELGDPLIETDRRETWATAANVSQLLFGSGRVLASTRAARARIAGAAADYEAARQALLLDVARAYADVRQAQATVGAREATVANLQNLLQYAQAQFDVGVVTRTDVAQAQARYAQARTQLVQAQGAMAASVESYRRLVGRAPANLQAPMPLTGLPLDLDSALAIAVDNSPALISAQAETLLADANVDVAASQGRVNVTAEAGYALGADFDDGASETSTDSVGVRVAVPLYQGGAVRSRTRQARALRAASNLDLAAAERAVRERVTNAWTGLASARSALHSAREQVEASELAYEGVRLEQETGSRSTIEVLDQEADLLAARIAFAQAERDLVVAERQLLAAIGTLDVPVGSAATDQDELRGR